MRPSRARAGCASRHVPILPRSAHRRRAIEPAVERFDLVGGHRRAEQEPLAERAALALQELVLVGRFDALGQRLGAICGRAV